MYCFGSGWTCLAGLEIIKFFCVLFLEVTEHVLVLEVSCKTKEFIFCGRPLSNMKLSCFHVMVLEVAELFLCLGVSCKTKKFIIVCRPYKWRTFRFLKFCFWKWLNMSCFWKRHVKPKSSSFLAGLKHYELFVLFSCFVSGSGWTLSAGRP